MVLKRQFGEGAEEDSEHLNKRRHLFSTIFKGVSSAQSLQDDINMPILESRIRKIVREEVNRVIDSFPRFSDGQTESSGSRTLQLQFLDNFPHTLYTGNRIVSKDGTPIKFALRDSASGKIVTVGPYSSMKVNIVVLEGDFDPDCHEDWSKKVFDGKVVQNREGKRPLVTGELVVQLKDGIGCIGDVSFTDNSSWIRSGKFRLGVKVHSALDQTNIREGISDAFKVKDHRGESYEKHHPPSWDDEVWRLEKIAKNGASHKRLTEFGISNVREFLRLYARDQSTLRTILGKKISSKKWDAIIQHATTCTLDDKRYIYRTPQGTVLILNSIYKVIEVTFDGHTHHSVDSLNNTYEKTLVEDLKQVAYRNLKDWQVYDAGPNIGPLDAPLLVGQGQLEMQMNTNHPTISLLRDCEVEQENSSFEIGESSQMQGINMAFSNSFTMNDSSGGFYNGEQTWTSKGNHMESQLSPQDFTVDDNFEVERSAPIDNGFFLVPTIIKSV